MKSNVFTLLAPSAYSSQQICTEVQTMTNITCANPFFAQQQTPTNIASAAVNSYHTTNLLISHTRPAHNSVTVGTITFTSAPADSPIITTTITSGLPAAPGTSVIVYGVVGVFGGVLLVTILIWSDTDTSEEKEDITSYCRSVSNSV